MTAMTMELGTVRRGAVHRSVRPATRLRLTARGRAARRLAVIVLAALAVLLIAWRAAGAGVEGSAEERVVVAEGQTLSHVAAEQLPEVPVARGVLMLQEANGLGTSQVQAGQELVVPQP